MKLITRGGYFRLGPNKDGRLDSDIIHTISNIALFNHKQLGKISDVLVYLFVAFFPCHKFVSGNCVLCAGCFTSGTSSPSTAGGTKLPDSMEEMKRYPTLFNVCVANVNQSLVLTVHVRLCFLAL